MLDYRILGPLEVADDGRGLPLGRGREWTLLAALLVRANEVVSTDRLIEALWGERPPPTAAKALQGHVSQLRKLLGEERLITRAPGYLLRLDGGELDAGRFAGLLEQGRQELAAGRAAAARETLERALELWRGEPLAEFAYEGFARGEIERLEELHAAALEERIEAELALGRHADVIAELERLVARHPLRERLRGQLMLALFRCGRQAEALEVYQDARHALAEQLGLDPGEALQELERAILARDAGLAAPPRVETVARPASSDWLPGRQRRRPRPYLVGALALCAVAAVAYLVTGGGDEPAPRSVPPDSLAVIDPGTNRVIDVIPVGARPTAVAIGHGSVWVANGDDETLSRIDPKTRKVVKTIGIGAAVDDIAFTPGAVWVANGNDEGITRIDPRYDVVVRRLRFPTQGSETPNVVFSLAAGFGSLWATLNVASVVRIDPRSGNVVGSIDVPLATGVAAGEGGVWVSTIESRVLRIDPDTESVTATAQTGTFAYSVTTGEGAVWVIVGNATPNSDALWRIDPSSAEQVASIRTGSGAGEIATGAGAIWVANSGDGTIARIDPRTNEVVARVPLGAAPSSLAVGYGLVWAAAVDPEFTGLTVRVSP